MNHAAWALHHTQVERMAKLARIRSISSENHSAATGLSVTGDLMGRLAVVPMSQEARGLDAGPRLTERLVGYGDNRSAAIVARISLEEKAHVAVGRQQEVVWQSL